MPHRRALVVAPFYSSSSDFPPLPGALELVRRVEPVLAGHGGYDVRVVSGPVDKAGMRQELATFFDSDGELLLYFYGHGCVRQSGAGVFATSDARPFDEGVDMIEVAEQAGAARAREVVMIVDCCHAEACLRPVGGAVLAGVAKLPTAKAGRAFLASSREHQAGWEATTDRARLLGAFSATVLDGLEGAAAARFAAGQVGAMLLGQYVLDEFHRWGQDPVIEVKAQGGLACTIVSGFAPEPGAPPKAPEPARIHGAPFRPSTMFVGRAAEIDSLRTLLIGGDRRIAVSASVEGLGGVGKTELVLQFTQQPDIQARYRSIVWLDAAGPLVPQWEKLARDLGLPHGGDEPGPLIGAVAQALGGPGACLFILDNAVRWDAVSALVPPGYPLLVTTRAQGFGGNGFVHASLDVLDDESARDLLVRMVPALAADESLPRLVDTLQGHALALELAGWHINHLGGTAREYLDRLARHDDDLPLAVDATAYGRTVEGCLSLTWDSLVHPASRALWRRASLFAPVSAHRDLLRLSLGGDQERRLPFEERGLLFPDPRDFDAAYAELRSVHVLARVEGQGERWAMHRLVRDFGRARLQTYEASAHVLALAEWLRRPTLPLGPEAPHLVAAILEAARHGDELATMDEDRYLGRELFVRQTSDPVTAFRPELIISYLREHLRDPRAMRLMVEGLTDVNEDVRVQAIAMIDRVGSVPEVLDGLAASLADREPRVRERAISTLAAHATDRTVELIAEAARTADRPAAVAIVSALGLIGTDRAWRALRELMATPSLPAREEAAVVILAHGPDTGAERILAEGLADRTADERAERFGVWLGLVPDGYGRTGGWRRLPTEFLIWCLRRPWLPAERDVVLALGAQRATAAIPVLLHVLGLPYGGREAAAEALGLIGDPAALDRLDEIAEKDNVEKVRVAARRAAERIRGTEDAGA